MSRWWEVDDDFDAEAPYDEAQEYTDWQLGRIADELLKADSKRELCRKCDDKDSIQYGEKTGQVESMPQFDADGNAVVDGEGNTLYVDFPELVCAQGHRWYEGEGKARGIGGDAPILFENHLQDRRRREIYTAVGTPDPSIVQGMYNRTHPQGRKVNSKDQRRRNGASFFR